MNFATILSIIRRPHHTPAPLRDEENKGVDNGEGQEQQDQQPHSSFTRKQRFQISLESAALYVASGVGLFSLKEWADYAFPQSPKYRAYVALAVALLMFGIAIGLAVHMSEVYE